jgi:hypothetical protein
MRVQIFRAIGQYASDDLHAEINCWFEGSERLGHPIDVKHVAMAVGDLPQGWGSAAIPTMWRLFGTTSQNRG